MPNWQKVRESMRLIDADKLENVDFSECMDSMEIMAVIDAQPTAYDVNKVVEQLEKERAQYWRGSNIFDRAIEIVKKGGVEHERNTV